LNLQKEVFWALAGLSAATPRLVPRLWGFRYYP